MKNWKFIGKVALYYLFQVVYFLLIGALVQDIWNHLTIPMGTHVITYTQTLLLLWGFLLIKWATKGVDPIKKVFGALTIAKYELETTQEHLRVSEKECDDIREQNEALILEIAKLNCEKNA